MIENVFEYLSKDGIIKITNNSKTHLLVISVIPTYPKRKYIDIHLVNKNWFIFIDTNSDPMLMKLWENLDKLSFRWTKEI